MTEQRKFTYTESKTIDEGRHTGVIKDVEYRDTPYAYADVIIECEGLTLKAGYPANVETKSRFGELLAKFATLKVGSEIVPRDILRERMVTFMVLMEKSKKDGKMYARIIPESVKPAVMA